jgi:hypothetical protein
MIIPRNKKAAGFRILIIVILLLLLMVVTNAYWKCYNKTTKSLFISPYQSMPAIKIKPSAATVNIIDMAQQQQR